VSQITITNEDKALLMSIWSYEPSRDVVKLLSSQTDGLHFNAICNKLTRSRTTVHRALGELMRHGIVVNSAREILVNNKKKLARVYQIDPKKAISVRHILPLL